MEALLTPLEATYAPDGHPYSIDLPYTSRLYKALLQGGHFSHAENAVVSRPNFNPSTFATGFLRHVKPMDITAMARGGGTFVIASLLERVTASGTPEECLKDDDGDAIKGWSTLMEGMRSLEFKAVVVT
jgi:pumilio family protein 6